MRNFGTELHKARTKDGYHIHLVRIINPKITTAKLKRPVVFNHGLIESSTVWLINSKGVEPLAYEHQCGTVELDQRNVNTTHYINGPMMLANNGYDVWLMSMRGTDWSLKHDTLSPKDPQFWNYCLDDFALVDVPTVIDYIRLSTGALKIGYIGHSQATFSVFGLLSARPSYADVLEPVIAVAPVAYFDHITSIARLQFIATLIATNKNKHGPFPSNAKAMRKMLASFCDTKKIGVKDMACQMLEVLVSGTGKKWLKGYYSHYPFYSSLKVLRHFGQLIKNKRFMMYDYGEEENLRIYGSYESPSYPIEMIRSKSLCLISTKADALSPPEDVERFKERLTTPIYKHIFIEGEFNHLDLITHEDAGKLVFAPILEIFETFERESGICAGEKEKLDNNLDFSESTIRADAERDNDNESYI